MNKVQFRNSILLFLTAVLWGMAFVAQSAGMDYVKPFTFNGIRSIIGGLVLIPCIMVIRKCKGKREGQKSIQPIVTKTEFIGGICCGLALFVASSLQQFGIVYTTVGKAGFITALYVVLVPILGLFMRKRVSFVIWICVTLSVVGLYLLCMTEGAIRLQLGDALVLICAVVFSIHILVIDYFSPRGDGVVISCIQFLTCGVLSIAGIIFEQPEIANIMAAKWSILYAGVLSCGVGYTLQVVGQKDVNPTVASLILCLESVVAMLGGWLILGEKLSSRQTLGCVLMFGAIVMAQLPIANKKTC